MPKATRRNRPAPVVRPVMNTFYVHDKSTKSLGGVTVMDGGDDRVVSMTDAQAQYWLDQGVISTKPLGQHDERAQRVLRQLSNPRVS